MIVHAGDIGTPELLEKLRAVAPVEAVRGNVDLKWAREIPDTADITAFGKRLHVLHNLRDLAIDPHAVGVDIVISGHSHVAKIEHKAGVLYLNPGSAGPRRFKLPTTLATIEFEARGIHAEIVVLDD